MTTPRKAAMIQSPGRRRFLRTQALKISAAAVVGLGTPAYACEIEPASPVVTKHDIAIMGWPKSASGLKIGQLSDLHCQDSRAVERAARAAQILLAQRPDIVFLTGEYLRGVRV